MTETLRDLYRARILPLLAPHAPEARRERLADALDRLPSADRVLVALYWDQELTMAECACVLEVSDAELTSMAQQAIERRHGALTGCLESAAVSVRARLRTGIGAAGTDAQ